MIATLKELNLMSNASHPQKHQTWTSLANIHWETTWPGSHDHADLEMVEEEGDAESTNGGAGQWPGYSLFLKSNKRLKPLYQ